MLFTVGACTTGAKGARGSVKPPRGRPHRAWRDSLSWKYPANASKQPACMDAFAWFDHVLLGKDNAVAREKAVHYYVMGDPTDKNAPGNVWAAIPTTGRRRPRATPFYFHPDGTLLRANPPKGNDSKTYAYDPTKPVPNIGGQELGVPLGPMDLRRGRKSGRTCCCSPPTN